MKLRITMLLLVFVLCAAFLICLPQTADAEQIQTPAPYIAGQDICPCKSCDGKPYTGTWTMVTTSTTSSAFVDGGHYKITGTLDFTDISFTTDYVFNIAGNKELVILVENGTMIAPANVRAFRFGISTTSSNTKVWLLGNNGKITGPGRPAYGTMMRVGPYGTLNIDGDLVVELNAPIAGDNDTWGIIDVNGGGTLNLHGGRINGYTSTTTDATKKTHGTGVYVWKNSTLNISGGVIVGGETKGFGGAVYSYGTVKMTSGAIYGGNAAAGGAIYLAADSSSSVYGSAELTGGKLYGGTVARVTVDGSKTYGTGGAIHMDAGTRLTIDGTDIIGGKAYRGGCIYAPSSSTVTMKSGTVSGGDATNQGGAVFLGGTFNMSGGTVTANPKSTYATGKGFRVQNGKLNLSGTAHVISAGSSAGNAIDLLTVSKSSLGKLTLADQAKVTNPGGTLTDNIYVQNYSKYPAQIEIKAGWSGEASVYFGYLYGENKNDDAVYSLGMQIPASYAAATGDFTGKLYMEEAPNTPPIYWDGATGLKVASVQLFTYANGTKTATWHKDNAQGIDAYAAAEAPTKYLALANSEALDLKGNTVYVDFNGYSGSEVTLNGGKLYLLDSTATTEAPGVTVTVTDGAAEIAAKHPFTSRNYVTLTEEGSATVHAVSVGINTVTVRPSSAGIYYKGFFECDDTLKPMVENFGIAVSLKDMPGKNFAQDGDSKYTENLGSNLGEASYNSVLIQDILKDSATAAENKERGEGLIYARAYMNLLIDGEPVTLLGIGNDPWSMESALQWLNTYWDTLSEEDQTSLAEKLYAPYISQFSDDWNLFYLRIKAKGGLTPEEEQVLAARRDAVVDYMEEGLTTLWRSDAELNYALSSTRDAGVGFTIVPGRLYMGLPYAYAVGTQKSFLEYATGEPDEKGIYTITGLDQTALNYESYGARVGNDCSGAVSNAWSTVANSFTASRSADMRPDCGVFPVGNYVYNPTLNPDTGNIIDTEPVVLSNGEQTMYEAYAMMQKADAAFHVMPSGGNHIRMVLSVHVVRNADGTIDGSSSYVMMHEQTRHNQDDQKTTTLEGIDETVYVIGGVNVKYTFANLFKYHYIPVTIQELRDPTPIDEIWVEDTLEEDTIDNIFEGSVLSNTFIDCVTITITDENGEVVQQLTGRARRRYNKNFQMERFVTEKLGSMKGSLDLDGLEAGTYRCTVVARTTTYNEYTVRDFTFVK